MSSRQLKKLRAQEEQRRLAEKRAAQTEANDAQASSAEEEGELDEEDDGDNVAAVAGSRPRAKNVFAAFAAIGDEGDNSEQEEVDDEDEDNQEDGGEHANAHGGGAVDAAPHATRPKPPSAKKKKTKKKKKKGKATETPQPASATRTPAGTTTAAGDKTGDAAGLDEIDRALAELQLPRAAASTAPRSASTITSAYERLFHVNFHHLRVLNELRDIFGRDTIHAAAQAGADGRGERAAGNPGVLMVDLETFLQADPPPPPGMVRVGGGAGGRPSTGKEIADVVARRNPFIQWKDTWPRATSGGLSMRQVAPGNVGGVIEYAFVHSPAYVELENTFYTVVMMHDVHPMIQFLKQHPYHIASLIQVSRVAKQQDQNAALAADLCERALFSFGRATLSAFRQKLAEGRARLSFRRPENRQFLLAGYYYIASLIPRGTYRTALAWTKLFLSVMPDDEYALLLYAHVLAVRAFEAQWLIDFFAAGGGGGDEDDDESDSNNANVFPALRRNPMRAYIRQSLVPARLQTKDAAGARAALARGFRRLPWLYGALFQALNLDVPRAVWGIQPRDEAEALYTQLYVHLAKDIWNTGQATSLLQAVAAAAAPDQKPDPARLPRAEPVPLSVARFVYLDGTPALMALVPRDMLHAVPNYDFDPLPPPREANEFSNVSQERPWLMAQDSQHHRHHHDDDNNNMFQVVMPDALLQRPPGEENPFDLEEDDDFDDDFENFAGGGSGGSDDEDEEVVIFPEPAVQRPGEPVSPQERPRRGNSGMPGAWVEDVDDEEYL
ncbi:nulp1-pending protein [Niveomyces insectorum RCEF 264]|uniref:Nulp1-pending protein n=1 Tax=Niveomyces insectorum RCEF 264 TaxID=1081102 RepID=A0A167QD38_9HYPO|nr:nulp1-pending protein [Niveomyces insectorum RCEF 264]